MLKKKYMFCIINVAYFRPLLWLFLGQWIKLDWAWITLFENILVTHKSVFSLPPTFLLHPTLYVFFSLSNLPFQDFKIRMYFVWILESGQALCLV